MVVLKNKVLNIYYYEIKATNKVATQKYIYFGCDIDKIYIKYPDNNGGYVFRWFKMQKLRLHRDTYEEYLKSSSIWEIVGTKADFFRQRKKKTTEITLEPNPRLQM